MTTKPEAAAAARRTAQADRTISGSNLPDPRATRVRYNVTVAELVQELGVSDRRIRQLETDPRHWLKVLAAIGRVIERRVVDPGQTR